jgi:hypothetical protein
MRAAVVRAVLLCCHPNDPQHASDFMLDNYAGVYCGTTVFTTLVLVETHMLFYTIALPIAETLNYAGVPAMFWFHQARCGGLHAA